MRTTLPVLLLALLLTGCSTGTGSAPPPSAGTNQAQAPSGQAPRREAGLPRKPAGSQPLRAPSPQGRRKVAHDGVRIISGSRSPSSPGSVVTGKQIKCERFSRPKPAAWERYDSIEESGFKSALQTPLSTLSIDVDTASYSNVRRFLREGKLPPAEAVRVEELLNYFSYDYPDPTGPGPFSTKVELSKCPWNSSHLLMHLGIQGRRIERGEKLPVRNLVFLIDVSGSMDSPDKLPLLKSALRGLVEQLTQKDRVAIVVYAGSSGLVLEPTTGSEKAKILAALDALEAGGSTNGGEGIELAYRLAQKNFVKSGVNRVLLATDGDFNVGVSSDDELVKLIEEKRKSGVFLSVLAFGTGNLNDSGMEKLADKGNGNYAYIDSLEEGHKVLVAEAGATLIPIAKDVKIQVEMNPSAVAGYRLIGYENRELAAEDFNDDAKDAGEIGAGHSVTALYELVPAGQPVPGVKLDKLRYQQAPPQGEAGELLLVKIRHKLPDQDQSRLQTFTVESRELQPEIAQTSDDFRFSAAVAGFGMLLRGSAHRGQWSYEEILTMARGARGQDSEGYRSEFLDLVARAAALARERADQASGRSS